MSRPIQLKRLLTTNVRPLPTEILLGELCLNVVDGKVFLKLDTDAIICVGMDVEELLTAISGKAPTVHTHPAFVVDWSRPGAIGQNTPNTGAFTTITTTGTITAGDRIACPQVTAGVYRNNVTVGTNIAALATEIRTGQGTGVGALGDIAFTTADQVASGATQQNLSNKMLLKGRGALLVGSTTDNGVDRLQINGSASFTGAAKLASFTVSTVPSAAGNSRGMVYVSNEAGGATPAFSDGVSWRRIHDRAVIS